MTIREFDGFIGILESAYNRKYPAPAKKLAFDRLESVDKKSLEEAINRLMLESSTLPPLQRVIDATERENKNAQDRQISEREKQAQREKDEFRHGQAQAFGKDSGIAYESTRLIKFILASSGTPEENEKILNGIRYMDKKYPHAGWATTGARMQRRMNGERVSEPM